MKDSAAQEFDQKSRANANHHAFEGNIQSLKAPNYSLNANVAQKKKDDTTEESEKEGYLASQTQIASAAPPGDNSTPIQMKSEVVQMKGNETELAKKLAKNSKNKNFITDEIFYRRHPELNRRKLKDDSSQDKKLRREWNSIKRNIVSPVVKDTSAAKKKDKPEGKKNGGVKKQRGNGKDAGAEQEKKAGAGAKPAAKKEADSGISTGGKKGDVKKVKLDKGSGADGEGLTFESIGTFLDEHKGNIARSILEVTRLVPGVGVITGAAAQVINIVQDNDAANDMKKPDPELLRLVNIRGRINIVNGVVDDLLYLNQIVGDVGGHATGVTETIAVVGGLINSAIDGAQVGTDIVTWSYADAAAEFPELFSVGDSDVKKYKDFSSGYAANTVADTVSGIMNIIDLGSTGLAQGMTAKTIGNSFLEFATSKQTLLSLAKAIRNPKIITNALQPVGKTLIGLGVGIGTGVWGKGVKNAPGQAPISKEHFLPAQRKKGLVDHGRDAAAANLLGHIGTAEKVWEVGSKGVDTIGRVLPIIFEQQQEHLKAKCGGVNPIDFIKGHIDNGLTKAVGHSNKLLGTINATGRAEKSFTKVDQNLAETLTAINGLTLPKDIFDSHTEIGDSAAADLLECVVDKGAKVANKVSNVGIQKAQILLDSIKKKAAVKIAELQETVKKVLAVLKNIIKKANSMYQHAIKTIETFRTTLKKAVTLEDYLNVGLKTISVALNLDEPIDVATLKAGWDELKVTMDSSFAFARKFIKAEVASGKEDPGQMKASSEPSKSIGNSDSGDSIGSLNGKIMDTMGVSMDQVKINSSSQKAVDLNAQAFSQGNEIHFAPGKFQPGTGKGDFLIAHEMAHLTQKSGLSATTSIGGTPVNDDPKLEKEADKLADKALSK